MKKQEFRKMRRGLGTSGTTLNIPPWILGVPGGEEEEQEIENLFEQIIVEEGLEKWIVLMHRSGEMKQDKERVVHPDMTGKLAWRLILEAHHQELNNRACSLKFARGIEQPWLCIHMSLKLLGVYAIDNNCFLLWMPCYPPSFFSYSINMMRKPSSGLFSLMLLSPLFLILSSTSAITLCSPPFTLQHMQKLFILMRSNLFILSFVSLALGDISVKILLCEISEIFLPIF